MNISKIEAHFTEAKTTLELFIANPDNMQAIARAAQLMIDAVNNEGKIMSCGNGGSLCDAMHFAEEMTGRYRENRRALPAIALSDASHISCVSNDYGYKHVFERMVDALGNSKDVLLAISTSGNSENVISAIEAARRKGMKVVGLTGKDGGKMAALVDVEIRAPHSQYADRAQEIHIKVIHALIDAIEEGCCSNQSF